MAETHEIVRDPTFYMKREVGSLRKIFKFIGLNFPNKHCPITVNLLIQIGKYRLQ